MNKNIILIVIFIFLSIIISLFPPYSWGNEKLKTTNERQSVHYYYGDKIPIKEYDFLFNDLKKEFIISNHKISLERHLIISELLIELFIAFLFATLIQYLYNRFSYKALVFALYVLSSIIFSILALFVIDEIAFWFQPNYSSVSQLENKIRHEYKDVLLDNSAYELSLIVDDLNKGFQNDWRYSTNQYWHSIYSSINLNSSQYPQISNFIEKTIPKKESNSRFKFNIPDWDKEFVLDNFHIYKDYSPPRGFSVNYTKLRGKINLIKYQILVNVFKSYPPYISTLNNYRQDFHNFWNNTIPKIKLFAPLGIILILSILFYLLRNPLAIRLKMYKLRLPMPIIEKS